MFSNLNINLFHLNILFLSFKCLMWHLTQNKNSKCSHKIFSRIILSLCFSYMFCSYIPISLLFLPHFLLAMMKLLRWYRVYSDWKGVKNDIQQRKGCFIVFTVIFVYLFKLCFVTLLCNTVYLLCIFVVFIMNVHIIILCLYYICILTGSISYRLFT
jgi:hypothetical protein